MKNSMYVFVSASLMATAIVNAYDFHDDMKDALDDMQQYFDGKGAEYNQTYYNKLVQCFHKYNDTTLYQSQIAAWIGVANYWKTNATNKDYMGRPDPWGQSSPGLEGGMPPFNEYFNRPNVSFGRYGIMTYEPCNYVSNTAYYHAVTKMCDYDWSITDEMQDNQKKSMATLAVGSAFMHQSYTYVGARFDNLMISVISYLGHQMMIQNLPTKTPMIIELQKEWRSMNSTQVVQNITDTIRTQPVPEWGRVLDQGDFPHDYFTNFGAITCNVICFIFPGSIATPFVQFLANVLLPAETPVAEKKWLVEEYLPTIVHATRGNQTPIHERINILVILIGVLVKLGYAFAYQEQFLKIPGFQTQPVINVGGYAVSIVNGFADSLTGFKQTDYNVNESTNLYPGQSFCKHDQGHSIWHEVSANGLLDLVYLCDHMNMLVMKYFDHSLRD